MKHVILLLVFGLTCVHASTLQDPTKPSLHKSMLENGQDLGTLTASALKLTAIFDNKQNKQAIINGKSFSEGQQVQGYKVVLISHNHVILKDSDGQQTLYVNNNNIKKDTNNGF